MWRAVYQLVLLFVLPFVVARLWWRGIGTRSYRARRGERFGAAPSTVPVGVWWFHTVSAGETIAAAPLIRAFAERFAGRVLVTTMTPTGADAAVRLLGNAVVHCYAPYDFGWAVRRFLDRVAPAALVLMETELWPNLIELTARRGVPVMLVNARLSERSARGYRLIGGLTRAMLHRVDWIACQYPSHQRRFVALGAPSNRVATTGSMKFDVVVPNSTVEATRTLHERWALGERPVWIAASTHPGEEEIVLRAHRVLLAQFPGALLILVPRHPERFDSVAALVERLEFRAARMTNTHAASDHVQVLIGDTMGQLLVLYGLAQCAFVGGSLVAQGGHNPIEPAALALPIVVGTHDFNFADVSAVFEETGCLHRVADGDMLARIIGELLDDPDTMRKQGAVARQVVEQNRGATGRILERLIEESKRSRR